MQFMKPNLLYRSMQSSLMHEKQILGAHTSAPSKSVLRHIKSKGKLFQRHSENGVLNLVLISKNMLQNNKTFIRKFSVYPPSSAL